MKKNVQALQGVSLTWGNEVSKKKKKAEERTWRDEKLIQDVNPHRAKQLTSFQAGKNAKKQKKKHTYIHTDKKFYLHSIIKF